MQISIFLTHSSVKAWDFSPQHAAHLQALLPEATLKHCQTPEEFCQHLPETDVAIVWRFEQEWLAKAAKLRVLATPAAGRDYFHIQPPTSLQLMYGEFHGELMAETVVGMILAANRGLLTAYRHQLLQTDPWPRIDCDRTMRQLRGSHVVIVGFGNIGHWIGKLLKPMGVRITGIKRTPSPRPSWFDAQDQIRQLNDLDSLLPEADHVVLALPGGEETTHLIDRNRVNLLSPSAWIHNIGRGNAIDETALCQALHEGRLGGACLDVFANEPLAEDDPLRSAPNVLLLPHASAIAPNYLDLFLKEFVPRLRALLAKND